MTPYPSAHRKLKAFGLAVQAERLKPLEERDLRIDSLIETAKTLDKFAAGSNVGPDRTPRIAELELVIQIERLKEKDVRTLVVSEIVKNAEAIDAFVTGIG